MITVGVDFAATVEKTAVVVIAWVGRRAEVVDAALGADDSAMVAAIVAGDVAAIDVPFGWPDSFIDLLVAHRDRTMKAPPATDVIWRRHLTLRHTDLYVNEKYGLRPLSVAADRIASAALRWSAVASRLEAAGTEVRRDGSGGVLECYPAASLAAWSITSRGYKGTYRTEWREAMLGKMASALPGLSMGRFRGAIVENDDLFDALVAALTARAAALGKVGLPSDPTHAENEGWIVVPTCELRALGG